jgi:predicted nucleic acid-binding Zn finger protein
MSSRIRRALQQRILVIEEKINDRCTEGFYNILGSTGKTYVVEVSLRNTSCTCPDFCQRGAKCKHIFFVLLQFSAEQVEQSNATRRDWKSKFQQRKKRLQEQVISSVESKIQRKPWVDTNCPICLEPFGQETVVYCQTTCGNNVHEICMLRWSQMNKTVECPLCRGPWPELSQ